MCPTNRTFVTFGIWIAKFSLPSSPSRPVNRLGINVRIQCFNTGEPVGNRLNWQSLAWRTSANTTGSHSGDVYLSDICALDCRQWRVRVKRRCRPRVVFSLAASSIVHKSGSYYSLRLLSIRLIRRYHVGALIIQVFIETF